MNSDGSRHEDSGGAWRAPSICLRRRAKCRGAAIVSPECGRRRGRSGRWTTAFTPRTFTATAHIHMARQPESSEGVEPASSGAGPGPGRAAACRHAGSKAARPRGPFSLTHTCCPSEAKDAGTPNDDTAVGPVAPWPHGTRRVPAGRARPREAARGVARSTRDCAGPTASCTGRLPHPDTTAPAARCASPTSRVQPLLRAQGAQGPASRSGRLEFRE